MPKTGRNIYKRKDGRWEGRYIKGYKETGKILYGYVYGKSYTEVKNKLINASALSPQPSTDHTQITFAMVAKRWLFNVSLKVKESTYANYDALLRNHVIPYIGGYKLHMITTSVIDEFVKKLIQNGRKDGMGGLSAKTVRDILSIVKSIFDYAYAENIINFDLKITYPKRVQKSMRVLSKQEQIALEKVLTKEIDNFKMGVLLSLYTGIRVGELCALRWKDILLKEGIISVRQTLQRIQNLNAEAEEKTKIILDTPKSLCSIRDIPLPAFINDMLLNFVSEEKSFFLSGRADEYTEPRTMQNYFKKYINMAGIDDANYHTTRHTFATRCIEAGVDIKSLSEILGHANVNITLNRYVHSSFEQKKKEINKLKQFSDLNKS